MVSHGGDQEEAAEFRALKDILSPKRARLYIAGEVISGQTPEEAIAAVDRNQKMEVDYMRIRLDDNLGSGSKMSPAVIQAVIQYSHELGYPIATHMYYQRTTGRP